MRILFITEKFPYPLDTGGKIRTYHILKGLSQEHRVTLVTTIEQEAQRAYLPELQKVCHDINLIPSKNENLIQLGMKIFKNFFSSVPIVVERHYLPAMAAEIQKLLHTQPSQYDVVHFDHLDASVYFDCLPPGMTTVLDEHNIVSNQIKTSAAVERNILKRLYMQFQLGKTLRYEADICRKTTRCFVCSDTDKTYLLKMAKDADVTVVPNGVNIDYFNETSRHKQVKLDIPETSQAVIFVGTLDYGPGGTAVRYFCHEILPLIHARLPETAFFAVGQNPPQDLQDLAVQDSRILVTGRVDDIRPYVARSNVFVVPLQSGSGTRLKILDAMAMGIPIVSTSIGAEGLDASSGENILLADTPEEFSSAVLQLLEDEALRKTLTDNARQFVRKRYSWNTIWIDLLAAYRKVVAY